MAIETTLWVSRHSLLHREVGILGMTIAKFNRVFEDLTPRQRKVLQEFLAGCTDEEIARSLYLEPSTVRRHLANICKRFNLSGLDQSRYSHRDELIDLFAQFKPDMVSPTLIGKLGLSEPEFPGKPLPLNSLRYVQRPIEQRCQREILKPGALIRIRAPRRTGKTSLLNQLLGYACSASIRTIYLNLRQTEAPFLASLDALLRWLSTLMSQQLGIPPRLDDYWDHENFGSIVSCTTYVQEHLLSQCPHELLLAIDEADWLFEVPKIAQGFFALLRSWHEEANNLPLWQHLRLVVVHSTDVYIPLNIHQSPFNVGLPVRLPNFSVEQVRLLALRYDLNEATLAKIDALVTLTGGHPYLVQLALYALWRQESEFDELLKMAPTQSGIYSHDLRRCWQLLQNCPDLQSSLKAVIEASPEGAQLDPVCAYKLESMGLVRLQGNWVTLSCDLYRQYFSDRLL